MTLLVKKINRLITEASVRYGLLEDGDHILIGLSGGKDSMALTELLALRSRVFKPRFSVEAAYIKMTNIPYKNDEEYLRQFVADLGIPLHIIETSFDATTDHRHTPCFLCSWNRRKQLFNLAQQLKCNKIALGHHQDDMVQTALMNLTFQGSFASMLPRQQMDKFPVTLIRPFCLLRESDLQDFARQQGYRQQMVRCPYENDSHRAQMQDIARRLEAINPDFTRSFFHAMMKG